MKHIVVVITTIAALIGIAYGTAAYLDSRDAKMQMVAAGALQQYEQTQRIAFLVHLLDYYRSRVELATTPVEREKYMRKVESVEAEIADIGKRR